ncbi:intraflagellar transport-associated protein isoform X3 [Misgurnus anguillicaudatus]
MPGLVQGSDIDDHDQAITEALDQFCSAPEQTYEQFFSTFTYLTPEDVRGPRVTAHRRHGDSSHSSQEEQREDEVSEMEREESTLTTDQEEVVLDAGCVGGILGGAARPNPEKLVKFDNYLGDSEDEEETTDVTGTSVLPGEVEEHLDASASSLCHHTLLEMSSTFTDQSTDKTQTAEDQNESDMVLPFHLDENFDYDTVVLTRKHSIREQNHRPS